MLTEHFIASIGTPAKVPSTHNQKDAAIFIHEHQPLQQQHSIFKKSATPPECLAISASHIFAAQADKAVLHVYSREKGNQEATVLSPERITCVALACNDSVLVLGTAEGRIMLWEIASGRQITTSQAHLQTLSVLAVDPTNNFMLSASADSTVHVWSLPALLSFATVDVQAVSPLSTFTTHRAEIISLALGHSSSFCNFAVSASKDKTCLIWDYHTGSVLRTVLLPTSPKCLALDAADRYVYAGYEDGSVQRLDLFDVRASGDPTAPIQPPASSRWKAQDDSLGTVLCLSVSFDGCTILTGHQNGAVASWDAAKGRFGSTALQAPLPGPVTNLSFLPVTGFPSDDQSKLKIPAVVKPKFGAFDSTNGEVPGSYNMYLEFPSNLPSQPLSDFERALTAPAFPQDILDGGLAELAAWGKQGNGVGQVEEAEDFMALDDDAEGPRKLTLEEQNAQLKQELEALRRVQKASFEKMEKMNVEKKALLRRQERRGKVNGASNGMSDSSDED